MALTFYFNKMYNAIRINFLRVVDIFKRLEHVLPNKEPSLLLQVSKRTNEAIVKYSLYLINQQKVTD